MGLYARCVLATSCAIEIQLLAKYLMQVPVRPDHAVYPDSLSVAWAVA